MSDIGKLGRVPGKPRGARGADHQRNARAVFGAAVPVLNGADQTLAQQLASWLALRIDEYALKAGTRMPSIRRFAQERGVSRSTVVEAYDRLIAAGYVESRRGSGFYVRARRDSPAAPVPPPSAAQPSSLDVVWLLRSMLRQSPATGQPGAGLLPPSWLDSDLIGSAVRAVGRASGDKLLQYGVPEGYLPLRQQLSRRLADTDIHVAPEQIITTNGVTHALDLVARQLVAPGDSVLVEDPAWYLIFARFAAFGANVIGVPRRADGPDMDVLVNLLAQHRPKLFVLSSVLQNPTSTSISAANAHRLLNLAEQHDLMLIEDDIYGDMTARRSLRLASLDQLRRVIYLGGFSKTLAGNLRVGFIATSAERAPHLTELKMLTGMTTSELTERVVARILAEGQYRRHLERLRGKLDAARDKTARALEKMGARLFCEPDAGAFLWADVGRDTNAIAAAGAQQDFLFAPGSLFSPLQLPSTWMRVSAAAALNPSALKFLAQQMDA